MLKKIIALVISAALLPMTYITAVKAEQVMLNEDFEAYSIGETPAGLECANSEGSVKVVQLLGNKALYNEIKTDGVYGSITKKFAAAENCLNIFSLSFRQKDFQTNGTVIMELYFKNRLAVKIFTSGKNIEYAGKTKDTVLQENYEPNVWYNIEVRISTAEKVADVFVDGRLKAQRLELLNPVYAIDELRSYSCYAPGYYIDNLSGYVSQNIKNAYITGPSVAAIPAFGQKSYEYGVYAQDEYDNEKKLDSIEYTFYPSGAEGVSCTAENGRAYITVESGAAPRNVLITADINHGEMTVSKNVAIDNTSPTSIEIIGERKIYGAANKSYAYTAVLRDENKNEVSGECVWSVENAPDGVLIDSATGVLKTSFNLAADLSFYICASCPSSGIEQKIKVITASYNTYNRDKQRMEAVKTSLDNILLYGTDPYNNTPLLADGLEKSSRTPALWRLPGGEEIAMSNLANQANLMMALDGFSALTGDNTYTQRVDDIYNYYYKNLRSETNGLFYWGGHTTIDLKKMKKAGYQDATIHEFKNHMPYLAPLFRIDKNETATMLKNVWAGHVTDWRTLTFNRHALYSKKLSLENTWDNTGIYDESTVGSLIYSSGEMPFRNAANDLLYCAYSIYENTGDETALLWAYRLLKRYNALADPQTKIGVYQFIQASQRHDPMQELEPVGRWNKIYPTPNEYTNSMYGDRAKNQFEQQFVDEGIIQEDERWKIREAYWVANGAIYKDGPLNDFKLAELFGTNSRTGKEIIKAAIEGMGSYAKLAYIPESNEFKYILSSGIDLTGYVLKTGGYYGDIGDVFSAAKVSPGFIMSFTKAYEMCGDEEEFADEKEEIWKVIRGIGKANGLGDLGEKYPGDNAKIDMLTSCAEPQIIVGLINIYRNTNDPVYLNLARRIGDNIVEKNFDGRFFVTSQNSKYVKFADNYAYILILLEAEIQHRSDEVPEFVLCEPYFHCDIQLDSGWVREKKFDRDVFWTMTQPTVFVRQIRTKTDYIELKKGEKFPLDVTVVPDDATDTSIIWTSSDGSVADTDGTDIYAYSEGVCTLEAVSADLKAKNKITVCVK